MTYFGFLAIFLGIPIAVLSILTIVDHRRGKWQPASLNALPAWGVMIALCVVAFVYTTPWDNYLVATGVWWYDIDLVNGLVIGYVPIEEYTFFLVQPVMTNLLLLALIRYLPVNPHRADNPTMRRNATIGAGVLWVVMTVVLLRTFVSESFKPATYLSLELSWALIPIIIQFVFGADILWRHRTQVFLAIAISTLYLSWADSIAIGSGTWTIDPEQSFHSILIGGILPIEEFIFFLITNTLATFGMTLVLAEESQERTDALDRYAALRPAINWLRRVRIKAV